MSFKKLKRIIGAVALSGLCAAVPALSGCNTDHPEAKITVSFDGVEYVLEYKLYRNMYPQTVQHFIELADNGFYDNTFVHNYTTSYWYAGGYDYVTDGSENAEVEKDYSAAYKDGKEGFGEYLMNTASKEKAYAELADPAAGKITPSVYKDLIDGKYSRPLTTLIGEFSNNQHKIDNGALKSSRGCLRMYYSSKSSIDSAKNVRVYLDKQGSDKGVMGDYNYNSATSMFSIQTSSTVSNDSSYCIFGVIKNLSTFDSLKDAVSAYRTKVGSTNFSRTVDVYVDNYDEYVGASVNEVSYVVTCEAIVIKSVKITKY